MKWVVIGVAVMIWNSISCQDLGFPTDEEKPHVSNHHAAIMKRKPLYDNVNKCPENMLLYPGPGPKSQWKCDCRPKFLFSPSTNSCYQAYMQGPCAAGDHFVRPKNEIVPKCVPNPCRKDGLVMYKGTCHPLRAVGGPCGSNELLEINDTTFEIECVPKHVAQYYTIWVPPIPCPIGSQRDPNGICRRRI